MSKSWYEEMETDDKIEASEWNIMTNVIQDTESRVDDLEEFELRDTITTVEIDQHETIDGNDGWTKIPFDSVTVDELDIFDSEENQFEINKDGCYILMCKTVADIDRDDYIGIRLMLNNEPLQRDEQRGGFRGGDAFVRIVLFTRLFEGDIIHTEAVAEEGKTITLEGGERETNMGLARI